uniref:Uncharacterized protein n=1 Tax=Lepeophtheirus salmonis TaxID=72036 RepID=A0A0K2VBF9_LEPSM
MTITLQKPFFPFWNSFSLDHAQSRGLSCQLYSDHCLLENTSAVDDTIFLYFSVVEYDFLSLNTNFITFYLT